MYQAVHNCACIIGQVATYNTSPPKQGTGAKTAMILEVKQQQPMVGNLDRWQEVDGEFADMIFTGLS